MLTSSELSELQAWVTANALPDTCDIYVCTQTNTKGSVSKTYTLTYSGVACRLMPQSNAGQENAAGDKVQQVTRFWLTLAFDQAISALDRVVKDGSTYEVVGVYKGHDLNTAVRCDCALVV
jgi:hypothetical protein